MNEKASQPLQRDETDPLIRPGALDELVLDTIPGIFYLVDRHRRLRLWNSWLEQVTGYSHEEVGELDALDFFDEALYPEVLASIGECFEQGLAVADFPMRMHDGGTRPFQFHGRRVEVGGEVLMAGVALDVSNLKEAEKAGERQRKQLEQLARHVPGMIFQLRRDAETGQFSMPYASDKIRDVFGVDHAEVADDAGALFARVHEDDIDRVMAAVEESAHSLSHFFEQFRMRPAGAGECSPENIEWVEVDSGPEKRADGSIVWHGFARLVTKRKQLERKLTRLAYIDDLTGLPNRAQLQSILEGELVQAAARRQGLGVMYLDLDSFNDINDAWGHTAGDRLLRRVGDRLSDVLGGGCTLGRIGGDEFLAVLRHEKAAQHARELAGQVVQAMEAPIWLDGREVRMTISTGISLFPDDADSGEDLIRHADAAVFRAKADGPGRWARYTPELTEAARARRYLETELRSAIENEQIQVALQPVVSLTDDRVVAVEALARWWHFEDGWILPDRFVDMAESRGLIGRLGEQVYRRAMRAVAGMAPETGLMINVAPSQLRDRSFCRRLLALAEECGLAPQRLEVELTEHVFMDDTVEAHKQIERLRACGISVAIDDFGTGFSSLAYLRRLPVQRLKIDRVFVRHIEDDPASAAIVRAVSAVAGDLGMKVTAEGVETESEARFVREVGCDCAQGWYFGRPQLVRDS